MNISVRSRSNYLRLCILYLIIPHLIFFLGWMRWYIWLPALILGLVTVRKFFTPDTLDLCNETAEHPLRIEWRDALPVLLILAWLVFSGIGGFVPQRWDWDKHNAILYDLMALKWPITYDLTDVTFYDVTTHYGIRHYTAGMMYYVAFQLPSSFFAYLTGGSFIVAQLALLAWCFIGMLFFYAELKIYFRKHMWLITLLLVAFSGMDILGKFAQASCPPPPPIDDIDAWIWSITKLEYPSFTTSMCWAPQHLISTGITTLLILRFSKNIPLMLFFWAINIFYSPFTFLGQTLLVGYFMLCHASRTVSANRSDIKHAIRLFLKPLLSIEAITGYAIALVLGLMFKSKTTLDYPQFFFMSYRSYCKGDTILGSPQLTYAVVLLAFCFIEFLALCLVVSLANRHNKNCKQPKALFYLCTLALSILPIFQYSGANDLSMRTSVPLMIIVFIYTLTALFAKNTSVFLKIVITVILLIGAANPVIQLYPACDFLVNELDGDLSNTPLLINQKLAEKTAAAPNPSMLMNEIDIAKLYIQYEPEDHWYFKYVFKPVAQPATPSNQMTP